jgi:hypothetical protein
MLLTRLPVLVTVQPPARNRAAAVSASPVLVVLLSTSNGTLCSAFADVEGDGVDDDGVVDGAALVLDGGTLDDGAGVDTVELCATPDVRIAA